MKFLARQPTSYFLALSSYLKKLVSEDVFEFQLLHLAEFGEGVEVHVGFFTEAHIDLLLAFDVLVVEVDDVLHGHLGVGLEEYLGAALLHVVAHLLVVEVAVDDTHLGGAGGADAAHHGVFGHQEVGLGLGHLVKQLVEGVHGVDELVVLRGDDGGIGEVSVLVARGGVVALSAVGEAAFLAHLLEYDGVHRAAEVLVEDVHDGRVLGVELLAAEMLAHVGLVGVVVNKIDGVLGDSLGGNLLVGGSLLVHLVGVVVGEGLETLEGFGTVVQHAVLVVHQAVHGVGELLAGEGFQLGFAELVERGRVAAIDTVVAEGREAALLVVFGVLAAFEDAGHKHLQSLFVGLGIGDDFIHKSHSLGHVLAEAADADVDVLLSYVDAVVASQFVELLLQLFGGVLAGAEIFEHVGSHIDGLAQLSGAVAEVEAIDQVEGLVLHVLHIQHFGAVFEFGFLEVFAEIDKDGLDGFHLTGFNLLEECALVVATHLDGGDRRLADLEDGLGLAFQLVDDDVVVLLEQAVGEGHNLALGNLGELVDFVAHVAPVAVLHIGVGHLAGAAVVAFGAFHDGELHVVDGCFEHPVVELALLDKSNLLVAGRRT